MACAKKHRRVVDAGRETAQAAKDGADRHDGGEALLKRGKDERAADLDLAAVPEQLIVLVDPKPTQVFKTYLFDTRRPRFGMAHGCFGIGAISRRCSMRYRGARGFFHVT
jgi:hypothetical protein